MIKRIKGYIFSNRFELLFLSLVYCLGVYFRLLPRLAIDPHLLTLNADIWERLSIAQYFLDHHRLPQFDLRYLAYGQVPMWYPPISPIFFAYLSRVFHLDIATISSRVVPFIEALSPLSIFFLAKFLFNKKIAYIAAIILSLTPSFTYWSGISDPQSLTLFLIPIYIILLVWRKNNIDLNIKARWFWVLGLSLLLALNFLTHLTYFLACIILLFVALALSIKSGLNRDFLVDFFAAIVFSQILTIWWWAPTRLYWWWIFALTTSSGLYTAVKHFNEYGYLIAVLELAASIFLLFVLIFNRNKKKSPYILLLFFWAFLPFLETQNETILTLIKHVELSWSTLFKPFEGFRFYCFLAQALALISAVVLAEYIIPLFKKNSKTFKILASLVVISALILDIYLSFEWNVKITLSGITVNEYNSAVWFRKHSKETDRIIADYYRVQMFAGVCGGKSLLGGLFPLRNVNFPYIKSPGQVQDDIYRIYKTKDPMKAYNLMKRYGCTHIFYSNNMIKYGGLGSKFKHGFGIEVSKDKFKDARFFKEAYNFKNNVIIEIKQ